MADEIARRLRTQPDEYGNLADDCGHCTLLPTVNGPVRAVQTGCPQHGDRVRTQAERDADGTTWRLVDGPFAQTRDPSKPPRPWLDPEIWMTTEPIAPPRRRWWHRYTRPTRKD